MLASCCRSAITIVVGFCSFCCCVAVAVAVAFVVVVLFFFFQAEDGIRDVAVTGVQTCALPIAWN